MLDAKLAVAPGRRVGFVDREELLPGHSEDPGVLLDGGMPPQLVVEGRDRLARRVRVGRRRRAEKAAEEIVEGAVLAGETVP